jgi:hypothetical protein
MWFRLKIGHPRIPCFMMRSHQNHSKPPFWGILKTNDKPTCTSQGLNTLSHPFCFGVPPVASQSQETLGLAMVEMLLFHSGEVSIPSHAESSDQLCKVSMGPQTVFA